MPVRVSVVLIAAVARNGVIGRAGALPWRIPEDLRRFRALTMGVPVVMGRRTFESLGRPLEGRELFVVSGSRDFRPAGPRVFTSLEAALDAAGERAIRSGAGIVAVAGGGRIYREAMTMADRMEITEVHADVEGDAFFPKIDADLWEETAREGRRETGGGLAYSFVGYVRSEPLSDARAPGSSVARTGSDVTGAP